MDNYFLSFLAQLHFPLCSLRCIKYNRAPMIISMKKTVTLSWLLALTLILWRNVVEYKAHKSHGEESYEWIILWCRQNLREKLSSPSKSTHLTLKGKTKTKSQELARGITEGKNIPAELKVNLLRKEKFENKRSNIHRTLRQIYFQRFVTSMQKAKVKKKIIHMNTFMLYVYIQLYIKFIDSRGQNEVKMTETLIFHISGFLSAEIFP